ncbi:dihydrodipicolinate synthase family protein [Egicoccus sp. AB-alg6-2]|uniref:dihydrodipicolinate synthase family protein n=1 Tax=Egicoccus sp. AB-alg6-2 TaxID=3242692 RepID=UPI00359EDBD0
MTAPSVPATRDTLLLPGTDGGMEPFTLSDPPALVRPAGPPSSRVVFAAAHVVADPLADTAPEAPAVLDWDATLAFRHHLWDLGLGVADAMDTAQRGMGLTWDTCAELIRRSAAEATGRGARIAVGVGTDHAPADLADPAAVLDAYRQQLEVVVATGATPILMASRQLVRAARGPEDYLDLYGRLLDDLPDGAILHWLGPMFDPALDGYWGTDDVAAATGHVLDLIERHASRVQGIKVSLLDRAHEVDLRRRLPAGVRMFTGDDFNYPELIEGDGQGYSDALLGILDPIAPVAASALQALDAGDLDRYRELLAPTVPLARHVFGAPTRYYKVGIVFLAWLAGHQPAFTMVGGLTAARSLTHLAETFRLADRAGLLPDPDLAAGRMRALLAVHGIDGGRT